MRRNVKEREKEREGAWRSVNEREGTWEGAWRHVRRNVKERKGEWRHVRRNPPCCDCTNYSTLSSYMQLFPYSVKIFKNAGLFYLVNTSAAMTSADWEVDHKGLRTTSSSWAECSSKISPHHHNTSGCPTRKVLVFPSCNGQALAAMLPSSQSRNKRAQMLPGNAYFTTGSLTFIFHEFCRTTAKAAKLLKILVFTS